MGRFSSPLLHKECLTLKLKCAFCDPVTRRGSKLVIKSIDTDIDDYLRDEKGKYYHTACYKEYLKSKKNKNDDEIAEIINRCKSEQEEVLKEAREKDKFLKWIMEYYETSSLSSYFMKKLQEVRTGRYQGLKEPIDYVTLLDIYNIMKNYLNKIASKKHFSNIGQRMNYDLAVVIGNYGDYKKYKQKQVEKEDINKQVDDNIEINKRYKEVKKTVDESKTNDFHVSDIIDDLLF